MTSIKIETNIGETMEIPLYDKVIVITGKSSSGKTKMINWVKACKNIPKEVKYSSIKLEDIIIINDIEYAKHIINDKPIGKYIFIDHYSFMENDDSIFNFIQNSKNIFIVMGHRNTSGLTSQDAILTLIHDGKNYRCEQIYSNGLLNPLEVI